METKQEKRLTRKARQLRAPVLPEEAAAIKRLAATAGLPVAAYLRNVALSYRFNRTWTIAELRTWYVSTVTSAAWAAS